MSDNIERQKMWSEIRDIRNATGISLREANDARIRYGSSKAAIEALAVPKARYDYESEYDRLRRINRELLEALQFMVDNIGQPASLQTREGFNKARAAIAKATGETK